MGTPNAIVCCVFELCEKCSRHASCIIGGMAALQEIFPSLPILIVDDDEESLLAIAATLRTAGVTNLRTISDSLAVPAILGLEAFSLVLLDLNMPGLSGYEILKGTELTCRPPFIIVTASLPPPDFFARLPSDVVAFLTKPVDRERLVGSVIAALKGPRKRSSNPRREI
jgi:DNA-binding NtrC family response regulator